ncbi:hypothetical protein [Roseomonas mucosa]
MIPSDPERLLVRKDAAAALTEAGYPISPKTLETYAVRGCGPTYSRFGTRTLYRWADLLDWAKAKVQPPRNRAA